MEPTAPQRRFAVLIDADNISATALVGLLAEVANFGVPIVKRIYGDWTLPNLKSWKEQLLEHAIQPIQQFRYTVGKNATPRHDAHRPRVPALARSIAHRHGRDWG
jgi:hypothetical protein